MAQSRPTSPPRRPTPVRSSWQVQRAVVYALFLREMKTRFGSKKLGYFWAIIQPATFVLVWWGMFALALRGGRMMSGIDFPMFLLTGFIPFGLFRTIVSSSMMSFQANKGLFNYRQVKPIDTLLARCLVECIVHLVVFVILVIVGMLIGFDAAIDDIMGLCLIMLLLVWFSFSLGLVFAMIAFFSETIQNVISFIMTPMLFLSGVIFPISVMPAKYHDILFLNPMLHFIELIRVHYFAVYHSQDASYFYIFCWIIGSCFLGLWLYSRLNQRVLMSS